MSKAEKQMMQGLYNFIKGEEGLSESNNAKAIFLKKRREILKRNLKKK